MNAIEKYFNAEKAESLLFILVGIAAITVAVYFILKLKQPFYNGMAITLVAVALIQITVGTSVYFRSPKDIERVNQIVQNEKSSIQKEEIPRMEVVMKNFTIYRWIEILLIIFGLVLVFTFPTQTFWKGIGIGLAIQAGFMLLLDYFAESRGSVYLDYLKQLV